jgi:hypothetical protein
MGKASKHRQCPALGREISRSDCGANRHSRYACPAACPHNPFALENYTALLATEDELDHRTMKWMLGEARDRVGLEHGLQQALRTKSGHGAHAFITWNLFFRRDERGLTCTQRWAQAGFPGLNNDERVFLQAKMQVRVVLFEVHRVLDEQRLEGVDLLVPEAPPMSIVDRSLAARAPRFATLLAWAYPLPHFWRLSGTAIFMPDLDVFEPAEVVAETVRHLGGPSEVAAMRLWLAEHFLRVDEALMAISKERHRLMLAGMDAQFGQATYLLQAPFAECRAALDGEPEIDHTELNDKDRSEGFAEARDWFDDTRPTKTGRRLLGHILLGQAGWRLEATGAARLAVLRERFEHRLGNRVRFERERRDDVGARMAGEIPPPDLSLVPPRLLQEPTKFEFSTTLMPATTPFGSKEEIEARFRREHLRAYADEPIPGLGGKTPRQAAGDPSMRKKLVNLIKRLVRQTDEANLRKERTDDVNGLLRELGLAEIDFPPPPPRAPPPEQPDARGDSAGEAEPEGHEPAGKKVRPAAPTLPTVPLDVDEVADRLGGALVGFATAVSAMDELTASGSTLVEDMAALTEGLISDDEFSFFITYSIHAWFALVPPGVQAPEIDYAALVEGLASELERVPTWLGSSPEVVLNNLTSGCRQPALLQLLMAELFDGVPKAPMKMRPQPGSMVPMLATLKVLINEMDRALRAG